MDLATSLPETAYLTMPKAAEKDIEGMGLPLPSSRVAGDLRGHRQSLIRGSGCWLQPPSRDPEVEPVGSQFGARTGTGFSHYYDKFDRCAGRRPPHKVVAAATSSRHSALSVSYSVAPPNP
ncbi:hypothetical protein CRG98_046899 [Punica granatum]|uniref:Uncharacterized protein n=1 Tax=Punica granatum TaxID=22663 RepID=A0A2I0HLY1_PUNGR|nr:hypothetical protein CRG98_046899 [Punica granatum]